MTRVSRSVASGAIPLPPLPHSTASDLRFLGAPGRSRTCDLEIRSRVLLVRVRRGSSVLSAGEGVAGPVSSGLIRPRSEGWRSSDVAAAGALQRPHGGRSPRIRSVRWSPSGPVASRLRTVLSMTNDRTQIAKIAANTRWAREADRSAATQPMRDGMYRKFEREVDPGGVLPPDELAIRVESARKAHYQRIALKSAQSRRAKMRGGS